MANYDSWVQDYSDNYLVRIFELGLKVEESASLRLDIRGATETRARAAEPRVARAPEGESPLEYLAFFLVDSRAKERLLAV